MKWRPLIVGAIIGGVAALFLAKGKGGNTNGITGQFAKPFQYGIDTGK